MFEYKQADFTTYSNGIKKYEMDGIVMESWEYIIIDFLNEVGRLGWELVDFENLIFKRKIEE